MEFTYLLIIIVKFIQISHLHETTLTLKSAPEILF